jgi:MoaA/NifB/PqqE/SkfB family radical SAM enzyme
MSLKPSLRRLTIETTSACDLRCVHCAVSDPAYVASHLDYASFEALLPALRADRPDVTLSGRGETLLHRRFMDMLDQSLAAGCRVEFQPNGTHLTPTLIDQLVARAGQSRLFQIKLSLDAADAGLFERIRVGARFDRLVDAMDGLQVAKAAAGTAFPTVGSSSRSCAPTRTSCRPLSH